MTRRPGHSTGPAGPGMGPPRAVRPVLDADQLAAFSKRLVAAIPSLRAFARGLCGHPELADDLAQEALAKAWSARQSYTPGTNFKAWTFTILRNYYFSWCRKQRRVAIWDPEVAEHVLVSEPAQPGHLALAELEAGMRTLPVQQREALVLVGAGGFSYQEAAEITGCAVGTVKSRVARGRFTLKAYMEAPMRALDETVPRGGDALSRILGELHRLDPTVRPPA